MSQKIIDRFPPPARKYLMSRTGLRAWEDRRREFPPATSQEIFGYYYPKIKFISRQRGYLLRCFVQADLTVANG